MDPEDPQDVFLVVIRDSWDRVAILLMEDNRLVMCKLG
jgi:hypothetical protein